MEGERPDVSDYLRDLVERCWRETPSDRPGMNDVQSMKEGHFGSALCYLSGMEAVCDHTGIALNLFSPVCFVIRMNYDVHRSQTYESASHMPKPAKKQPSPTNNPAYAAVCTPILGKTKGVYRNERNRWSITMTENVT